MADDTAQPAPDSSAPSGGSSPITRKVGPLPVWAWFVIAAGVVGVYLIMRSRSGNAATLPGTGSSVVGSTGTGVTQVDPLTGENLLTAVQQLVSTLQSQQPSNPSTAPATAPAFDWHFGAPAGGWGKMHYTWRLTDEGKAEFKRIYGFDWTGGDQPDWVSVPAGLGAYSWQLIETGVPITAATTGPPAAVAPTSGSGLMLARTNTAPPGLGIMGFTEG